MALATVYNNQQTERWNVFTLSAIEFAEAEVVSELAPSAAAEMRLDAAEGTLRSDWAKTQEGGTTISWLLVGGIVFLLANSLASAWREGLVAGHDVAPAAVASWILALCGLAIIALAFRPV